MQTAAFMKRKVIFEQLGIASPLLAVVIALIFTARHELDIIESPFLIAGIGCGLMALSSVIYGLRGAALSATVLLIVAFFVEANHSEGMKLAFILPPLAGGLGIASVVLRRFLLGWQKRRLVGVGDELQILRTRLGQLETLNAAGGIAEVLGEASSVWRRELKDVTVSGTRLISRLTPAQRENEDVIQFDAALRSVGENLAAQEMLAGGLKLDIQSEVHLGEIVNQAAKLVQEDYDRLGVTLEIDVEDAGVPCALDRELMVRAVTNLLLNAAEASAHGSKVNVVAASDYRGDRGVIEIIDKGSGINSDVVPYVFKPFFTTRSDKMGLGLPVAREIIASMGGSIALASNEARGMTFRVRVPMRRAELQGDSAKRAEARKEETPQVASPQDKIIEHIERLQKADS